MRALAGLLCIATLAWTADANVEKTMFLGPSPVTLPKARPGLHDLRLHSLSPLQPIRATQLPVQFPSAPAPRGLDAWYLLRGLDAGRRYEVRVCWPATQPTDFWLHTYPITHVFETPELAVALAQYSEQLQHLARADELPGDETAQAVLFLRIQAAASYYSTNRTLMDYPPPVDVDIILDPFMLNILPRSLGPVAVYIAAVAVGAWFGSGYIYRWLLLAAVAPLQKPHTD